MAWHGMAHFLLTDNPSFLTAHPPPRFFPASRIIYLSPGQSAELVDRKNGKARVKVRTTIFLEGCVDHRAS